MMSSEEQPEVVYCDAEHAMVVLSNLQVIFSTAEPSRALLDSHAITHERMIQDHQRMALMIVIDSDAKPPSDEIRGEIDKTLRTLSKNLVAVAHVVEGSGFVAAAKRSAVAMIALLARFPFPLRAFGQVGEAASWLAGRLRDERAGVLTGPAVAHAVEVARNALEAKAGARK